MRLLVACLIAAMASEVAADTIVATRTIRAQEIVGPDAVRVDPARIEGAYSSLDAVLGLEARVAIYPGRPVLEGTLGAPALVERNQIVELVFEHGGLRIATEGRALARGGVGERIRVMNLSSRTVLFGQIAPNGTIAVSK